MRAVALLSVLAIVAFARPAPQDAATEDTTTMTAETTTATASTGSSTDTASAMASSAVASADASAAPSSASPSTVSPSVVASSAIPTSQVSSSAVPSSAALSSSAAPPTETGVALHPNGNAAKCLDVKEANFADGAYVQIYDCNGSGAQQWIVSPGSTKVRVANTTFCLDAGSNPTSGSKMKIWTCYDGLPAQQWWYTGDNRIALDGKGLCLDLTDGVLWNRKRSQVWQCTDGSPNQVWTQ